MLAHEAAHIERRDGLWLTCATLCARLFPFQPLLALVRRGEVLVRDAQARAEVVHERARRGGRGRGAFRVFRHESGSSPLRMHSTLRRAARPRAAAWIFRIIPRSDSSNPARSGSGDDAFAAETPGPRAGEESGWDEDRSVAALRLATRPR